jgi:hypothetical protein
MRGETRVLHAVGEKGGRVFQDCLWRPGSLMLRVLLQTACKTS